MKETSGEPKNLLGLEGDRPRPGSAGGLPRALRAGQSFSGKECLARRGRPRPGPAWFARLTGPLAPPPGLAPDRGAPRSGGTRRPSPITQKLVRPVPDSWRRAPLQEKKKRNEKKEKASEGASKARGAERATHAHSPRAHPGDRDRNTRPSLYRPNDRSVARAGRALCSPQVLECFLRGLVGRKASPRPGS